MSSCILGDPEREPALKGWNETDGRRRPTSTLLSEGLTVEDRPAMGNECGMSCSTLAGTDPGGELVSDPTARTAFRAEMGLVPSGPAPWKVDRLPYVCCMSERCRLWRWDGREPASAVESRRPCSFLWEKDGRKYCSSAPMKRELSKDSESSTRKLQSLRYVTDA